MNFILFVIQVLVLIGLIYLWTIGKKNHIRYTAKQKKALILFSILGIIVLFPAFIDFGEGFINGLTAKM